MEQGDGGNHDFPASRDAMEIPIEFARNIAGIDNQQLSEGNVSPEQHERQQQVPEMMVMDLVDSPRERGLIAKQGQHKNGEGVGRQNLSDENDDGEKARVPVRVQR